MSRNHIPLNPRRWSAVRRAVFKRDGWRCCECGRACRLECDHIRPLEREPGQDPLDPNRLQTLCRRCQYGQTASENRRAPTTGRGRLARAGRENHVTGAAGVTNRTAIRQARAHLLFLPPYSADLNPIEQVFAKLKHLLRDAAKRTAEATWRRIGALLDRFSPTECANYFRNAGYASE